MTHPPYSNQASKYPASEELRIYFGDSKQVWEYTRIRNDYGPSIMLPPEGDYTSYQWPVRRREVLMIQIGHYHEEVLQSFCEHLVMEGAAIVRVVYWDVRGAQLAIFRPGARDVVAA